MNDKEELTDDDGDMEEILNKQYAPHQPPLSDMKILLSSSNMKTKAQMKESFYMILTLPVMEFWKP